jgi:starch synthase
MSNPLRILFVAAETAPFAKTGGLADVVGSLPKALALLGHDVRVVIPAYSFIERAAREGRGGIRPGPVSLRVPTGDGLLPAGVFEARLPGSTVPVYFIAERNLFDRAEVYGYWDDPYRFAFFSRAALDLLVAALGWRPDVIHAHDWHAAASVFWLATSGQHDERYRGIPSVITIHNLLHQGRAPWDILRYLGISAGSLAEEGFGEVNLLARAVFHATMVSTVSPTYSREILTKDGGAGLDALLRHRHFDVHGILNGLDYDVWDPARDVHLVAAYDADSLERRVLNKRALQARLQLPQRDDIPLVAMVSRLDGQKGLDIVGHVVHLLMNGYAGDAQFVVLGSGASGYEDMFRHLASYHRDKMAAVIGYDAALAPLVYGGSDIFLMPSLFEPCGLGQLIAMRYGSIPVVRATGGLADTVHDGVGGFTFHEYRGEDLWDTLRRATYIYWTDPDSWRAMQRHGMSMDCSWATSARGYQQLYEWSIARQRGW